MPIPILLDKPSPKFSKVRVLNQIRMFSEKLMLGHWSIILKIALEKNIAFCLNFIIQIYKRLLRRNTQFQIPFAPKHWFSTLYCTDSKGLYLPKVAFLHLLYKGNQLHLQFLQQDQEGNLVGYLIV